MAYEDDEEDEGMKRMEIMKRMEAHQGDGMEEEALSILLTVRRIDCLASSVFY